MVRKDIIDIVKDIRSYDQIKNIGMTSNGTLLFKKLEKLKEAGLNSLNISLDTLVEAKNAFITRRPIGFKQTMGVKKI
jgi:cyclic pyranopterin phosphate synthase